ncbi:MAG: LysR family transcriptional regulator [Nocardioides sp.]|uniref:LysR family transcriptional regulator n=1 Tax=Nocardioides sp. TaxID=35761 RepID=UPI003F098386
MRIEQLEYVVAVTQYGSLRKASERLHISQPALSEAVGKLERELGVILLDRRRSGSRISRQGRELLPNMVEVLESVKRLRVSAGDQTVTARVLRLGTVMGATSTVLIPAIKSFGEQHPGASVEVMPMQQDEIQSALLEGSLDLGLVNVLDGDDAPPDLVSTDLMHGRPVAVLPAGHPLAAKDEVTLDDLRAERVILMRSGFLMHRLAHRLFGNVLPGDVHSTDGAELGKLMVADGLGVTMLPDYSVVGDPLHTAGLITARPIAGDRTTVTLVLQHRRQQPPLRVRDLQNHLLSQAARRARLGAREGLEMSAARHTEPLPVTG